MATQEKLHKSLEALKNLSFSNQFSDHTRQKEKIQHCHVVTEAFSNPTIRVLANFQVLLEVTIETFLKLCDDPESDIRMTSDECLNRIIRAASDGHIGKIQIELHKEIRKNGSARSLRAALVRFSQLAHHTRPHKGKPYVVNLFPSIIKIAERSEELIHETLSSSLPKILKILGCFAPDNEIKVLLKAFLANVTKPSAVIRRTSSSCIFSICTHSRRPYVFVTYCLNSLLDILIPIDDDTNCSTILGVMNCMKILLPPLKNSNISNDGFGYSKDVEIVQPYSVNKLLLIYELCLYYVTNKDHNIVNAALETLNVLLISASSELKNKLLSENGLEKCRINKSQSVANIRSPSQLSVVTNVTSNDDHAFSECELTETIESDIEKWIGESKLSVINMPDIGSSVKSQSTDTLTATSETNLDTCDFGKVPKISDGYGMATKSASVGENLDKFSERSSEESFGCSASEERILEVDNEFQEIDIGEIMDKSISLLHCIRLLSKSFLLYGVPEKYISDKTVRVSVKSSALACLSSIFRIYPLGFFTYLDKNYCESLKTSSRISNQKISDIILFADHSDPQLRGVVRSLAAELLVSILTVSDMDFCSWISCNKIGKDQNFCRIETFVDILVTGLQDDNYSCLRQTLLSLNPTLNLLAESLNSTAILPILNALPLLASNSYWLVKVALCELVSKISYVTIYQITGNSCFQNKVLYNILFELLKEGDQRIRNTASTALVDIIQNLYFDNYQPRQSPETTKAIYFGNKYLTTLCDKKTEQNLHRAHFIENMPFPYSEIAVSGCERIDYSLSKVVTKLYSSMLSSNSKFFIHGCIEALSLLSTNYPCTVYTKTWINFDNHRFGLDSINPSNIDDIFSVSVSLLNSSVYVYDISFKINVMNLTANLYSGNSVFSLKPVDIIDHDTRTWSMFSNNGFKILYDQYLSHTSKLLNIFHHIINDILPTPPQVKSVLPHLPHAGTLSPIKRRKGEDKKLPSPGKILEKEEKIEKKDGVKVGGVGSFAGSQHYMKIYEVLRSSFLNYKTSLEPDDSENFLELLRKTLHSLSVILEIATLNEFGKISEEILFYMRSTFTLDSILTVQCVQQLLKCLFGTNLTANAIDIILREQQKDEEEQDCSFYQNIFQKPYEKISACIHSLSKINKIECDDDSTVMGYLHRRDVKKPSVISRTSDKTLANYIRIFEPMVIKSLKQYTVTSNVKLQCRVLQLLSQLVQLRVNYCLLDSEQVFKDFVLKQFEYIEEGQVPFSEELIPKIFQFFVHLSYSKQHTKSIISIPKIIQLCDGLMASGQDPKTHCIPALQPIVEDVFLTRNKSNTSDIKELETTREVVLSMLLRLLEYKEVIDLVILVLEDSKYCTDDTEKWLRWSEQVANVFLQLLRQNKIRVDNVAAFICLRKFVFALNPNVFKPETDLIVMLFQTPPTTDDKIIFSRCISKVIILLLLICHLKEDSLISKISKAKMEFSPGSIFENFTTTADPLNVYNNADIFQNISEEVIFARMIFRIVSIYSQEVLICSRHKENSFLVGQFSAFLMYCSHIFQSGSHYKISQVAISLLKKSTDINIDIINKTFLHIGRLYPTVAFHWCHILSVLNYSDLSFWNNILNHKNQRKSSINSSIVKIGGTIVFCDYLSENTSENKQLSWILSENSDTLVGLIDEMPVCEFISFIHRNAPLSKQFIESIAQKCVVIDDPIFKTKIIKCIENSHSSQTGAVIKLLIPKMLSNRQIAVSRMVANLASRKVEFLFTLSVEEVNVQLSKEELVITKEELNVMNLAKKHETLVSLLNKLLVQYYDMSPLEFNQKRNVNPEHIKKLQVDKKWYLSQIQGKYQDSMLRKETAKIMKRLEYAELVTFMSSSDFNRLIFGDCIEVGVKQLKSAKLKKEPPILKATVDIILKDVSTIVNITCGSHEVFNVEQQSNDYTKQILQTYKDEDFSMLLLNLSHSLIILVKSLPYLPTLQLSENDSDNISKFAVISLEYIHFFINVDKYFFNINFLEVLLDCSNEVLKRSQFSSYLNLDSNVSWLCSVILSTHNLVMFLLKDNDPLPTIEPYILKNALENPNTILIRQACHQLYVLICWLYKIKNTVVVIPNFLFNKIKSLVISLSRLPLVNSYNLMPSRVWKLGWQPDFTGKFLTQVPPLPIELLQEIDIFEEYIFRITLLGWTTRTQFEETWMCFLSVLCTRLDNMDSVDTSIALHASSLAIRAITALLMQTLRYPMLGNTNVSKIMHVPRNVTISDNSVSIRKLKLVQNHIEDKCKELSDQSVKHQIRNVFDEANFENIPNEYSYGQISVKYFLIATNPDEHVESSFPLEMYTKRIKMLEECGLDVNSCLQFLLDYYTQLIKAESAVINLRILHETVRSTVFISDLFTDKSQFKWMLDLFLALSKNHAVEDELLHQYLIVGICKSVAVLTPDLDIYEQTKKLLVQFLKSPFLSSRISCLYGILYILEGCLLSNITIGGVSEEMQLILPCAVEYIQSNLNTGNWVLKRSEEHTMLVWSLTFYLTENVDEVHMESNFIVNTLQTAFSVLHCKPWSLVQKHIVKGLERLLLKKPKYVLEKVGKQLLRLALEKMKDDNPLISILGVQLLTSYMYMECSEHLEKRNLEVEESSPDHLVQTIEKISAIFEKIKKSYIVEVEVLCSVLPVILRDFFSPSDILTKVIGEFLSTQQPHPKLMSAVVFQVFESAINQNQLSLLQDWVVFSLSNFTQSFSNMATWCLTCFFISASSNEWLRSFFPYVQARVGRYEYEDKKIFCIAGSDFYRNLTHDMQRKTFVDNFMKVKDHMDMPFNDLLNSL